MNTFKSIIKNNIRQYGMLIALVFIMIFFWISTDGILMRPVNITNLLLQNSYIIIMAIGMLLIIVTGVVDLSVGSVCGFIGGLAAVLMVRYHFNVYVTMLICLAVGAAIGAWNGFWVAYQKIPAFIVTLAGMLIFRGLVLWLLGGESVGPFPEEFQRIASGFIPDFFHNPGFHLTSIVIGVILSIIIVFLDFRSRRNNQKYEFEVLPLPFFIVKNLVVVAAIMGLCIVMASYKGLPNVLVLMGVLAVIYTIITDKTILGRRIYAMGGNEKATKLSGINTDRLSFFCFMNMGVLSALAGMVFAARLNSATPKAGNSFEMDVIAANYIGGASTTGGVGTVVGALVGAFIMGILNNGMSIMGINIDWQQVIKGMVLLMAVFFDVKQKNKSGK
ncbi:multiple monosaccharide ABC transporter permease [Flexilinea flocculi]|jgi:putative multiple sugar transport system permease protein|uniref:Xylose transport system permease protein XylH n=1 Tax=Flexilinea flocculi TaxID=1678840 RepID=A0A0K8PBD0_9CHLR|nr:multiple monosaccharide ABC transporter permease [Flexilinea flocculi]NMB92768.1 sugar ABC transporter permease [Flexilinea flocculi]GAP39455.1 ABC-type xylose transport system, permease component [Flexilinea flocculi]